MKRFVPTIALALVAASTAQAYALGNPKLPVVAGAQSLSATEKADVTGRCGCTPPPPPPPCGCNLPSKPGYGFGTTGHYGPPGQGFTPANNWRVHAAGDGLTPTGRALPPRAFK